MKSSITLVITLIFAAIYHIPAIKVDLLDFNHVKYIGRFDFSLGYPLCDWSGSTVAMNLQASENTDISIEVNFKLSPDRAHMYGIYLNNQEYGRYKLSMQNNINALNISVVLKGTRTGSHLLALIKLTEACFHPACDPVQIESINIMNANVLPAPSDKTFKFLFIGDSNTAAFGVDGNKPCPYTVETQNIMHSYASLVSMILNADYHIVAWSGKGVVRNFGHVRKTSDDPMSFYYNRTLATRSSPSLYWNPSKSSFQPNIVYIMLGTNDYSTDPIPDNDEYISAFANLIAQVQLDYPKAVVIVACEPRPRHNQCANTLEAAKSKSVKYIAIDTNIFGAGIGCQGHPGYSAQMKIADILIPIFKQELKIS